jgi:hypothetical protein
MILDSQTNLSALQAITSLGDTASTNVYDTGAAADVGVGQEQYLFIRTGTAFTSGGAGTLAIVLQDSADNSSWADVQISPTYALAALTANKVLLQSRFPIGLRRYIRVAYRVATAAMTGGTVDAFTVMDEQSNTAYASGFTVA